MDYAGYGYTSSPVTDARLRPHSRGIATSVAHTTAQTYYGGFGGCGCSKNMGSFASASEPASAGKLAVGAVFAYLLARKLGWL